jgi:hypothetical protein
VLLSLSIWLNRLFVEKMIFPPRLTKSTTDFSHKLTFQLLETNLSCWVQVIFTRNLKTGLEGSLYLNTGLHIDQRLPQICLTPPLLCLFQSLLDLATFLVAFRPRLSVRSGAERGREKQALDSVFSQRSHGCNIA